MTTTQQLGKCDARWGDDPLNFDLYIDPTTKVKNDLLTSKQKRALYTLNIDLAQFRPSMSESMLQGIRQWFFDKASSGSAIFSTVGNDRSKTLKLLKLVSKEHIEPGKKIQSFFPEILYGIGGDEAFGTAHFDLLRYWFNQDHKHHIFDKRVIQNDLPSKTNDQSLQRKRFESIIANSFTKRELVEILTKVETFYLEGEIKLHQYAYFNTLVAIRKRPESLRTLRVSDLKQTQSGNWCLMVSPAKANIENPQKIEVEIRSGLGGILALHRAEVIEKYGFLVPQEQLHNLALFPARQIKKDNKGWISKLANEDFGVCRDVPALQSGYLNPVNQILSHRNVSGTILRHSLGNHLAEQGMSSYSIQIALNHASDETCQAYVDIHFYGLIDQLSDQLEDAFEEAFPAFRTVKLLRDKDDFDPSKLIKSSRIKTGDRVTQGGCGSTPRCNQAPFTCYACPKFIPFADADHEFNLAIVEEEIAAYETLGHSFNQQLITLRKTKHAIEMTIAICKLHNEQQGEQPSQPQGVPA